MEKIESIKAPFTDEQVANLKRYQECAWVHPFTCCSDGECKRSERLDQGTLIPTNDGWVCPCGNYKQNWAHAGMAGDLPPDWRIEFMNRAKNKNDENNIS